MQLIKNISRKLWQFKFLCFLCEISNIQKCDFNECPLTLVILLTVFSPSTLTFTNSIKGCPLSNFINHLKKKGDFFDQKTWLESIPIVTMFNLTNVPFGQINLDSTILTRSFWLVFFSPSQQYFDDYYMYGFKYYNNFDYIIILIYLITYMV